MKNFYPPSLVILLFTVHLFFNSAMTGYSLQKHPGNSNNFFFNNEMNGCGTGDLEKFSIDKKFAVKPQKNEVGKEQPIAYKFKISFKKYNKQKHFTKENCGEKDFEFSKFSFKKIGKNNNLPVSRKSVS